MVKHKRENTPPAVSGEYNIGVGEMHRYTIAYLKSIDGYRELYTLRTVSGRPVFMPTWNSKANTCLFPSTYDAILYLRRELDFLEQAYRFFILKID